MQVFPILLVAVLLAADGGLTEAALDPPWGSGAATIAAIGPVLVILIVVRLLLRRLIPVELAGLSPARARSIDRTMRIARWAILVVHAIAVLAFGWLAAVRTVVGNLIIVDEVVSLLPPVVGMVGLWYLQYPLERRMRAAMDLRRVDLGQPVYGVPGRWRYVFQQVRIQLLVMLVPGILIVTGAEIVHRSFENAPLWLSEAAVVVIGLGVFVVMPPIARLILDVRPLDDGPVAEMMHDLCARHGVRVRRALRWNTDGSIMNAAVMGLIAPVRYVMVSDALLDVLSPDELHAVMAHEIGHIRRAHMPWLLISLLGVLTATLALVSWIAWAALRIGGDLPASAGLWIDIGLGAITVAISFVAFGWISRRYERQADTFAVQHLSGLGRGERDAGAGARVTIDAVLAMRGALGTIARIHAIDRHRPSWRHGAIAWRQAYLERLVGAPVHRLPIDRTIGRLRIAAVVLLATGVMAAGYTPGGSGTPLPPPAGIAVIGAAAASGAVT